MNLIVCVDKNWGIGFKGDLICKFKEDMNRFKSMTMGKTIIYGSKTLESFPGKKPLKGRTNVVLVYSQNEIPEESKYACSYYGFMKFTKTKKIDKALLTAMAVRDPEDPRTLKDTVLVCTDQINAVKDIAKFLSNGNEDNIFVCGGGSVYKQLLPLCDTCYVTKVFTENEADVYFPNLDELEDWEITDRDGRTISESGLPYEFMTYKRIEKD